MSNRTMVAALIVFVALVFGAGATAMNITWQVIQQGEMAQESQLNSIIRYRDRVLITKGMYLGMQGEVLARTTMGERRRLDHLYGNAPQNQEGDDKPIWEIRLDADPRHPYVRTVFLPSKSFTVVLSWASPKEQVSE